MRITTLTQAITVERISRLAGTCNTWLAAMVPSAQQPLHHGIALEWPPVLYSGRRASGQSGLPVMLVESDIRPGVRGVLP